MRLSDEILCRVLDPVPTAWQPKPGFRSAAVLVPLFARGGCDHLLYTLRRRDLPHHAGQVSFPGGAREGLEEPRDCALREAEEETGLSPDSVQLMGSLPPRLSIAGFWVHPLVGRIPAPTDLRPDPREVERMLEIPVRDLIESERWELRVPTGPHFEWDGTAVWGLTARFTLQLLNRTVPGTEFSFPRE